MTKFALLTRNRYYRICTIMRVDERLTIANNGLQLILKWICIYLVLFIIVKAEISFWSQYQFRGGFLPTSSNGFSLLQHLISLLPQHHLFRSDYHVFGNRARTIRKPQ